MDEKTVKKLEFLQGLRDNLTKKIERLEAGNPDDSAYEFTEEDRRQILDARMKDPKIDPRSVAEKLPGVLAWEQGRKERQEQRWNERKKAREDGKTGNL